MDDTRRESEPVLHFTTYTCHSAPSAASVSASPADLSEWEAAVGQMTVAQLKKLLHLVRGKLGPVSDASYNSNVIGAHCPSVMAHNIRHLAWKRKICVSDVVREAFKEYLDNHTA